MSLRGTTVSRLALGGAALLGTTLLGIALLVLDLSPMIVLAILVAGVGVPILVMRPSLGIHLLIPMIYVENVVYTSEMTGIKVAGAIVLAGWLLSITVNRRIPLEARPLNMLMVVLLAWLTLTMMFALDSSIAFVYVASFLLLGIVMWMFASVVDTQEKVRGVYRAIVLWTTLAAAHGLVLYAQGAQDTTAGLVLNRNIMATYIDIAIVCAFFLYQMSPGVGERVALLTALPLLFVALALTFSRTGYIALVVVFALVSYRLARTRGYLILAASVAMMALISAFLPERFYDRVESIVPSMRRQEETFGLRVELWKAGVKMVQDHPIVGVGPGNFISALGRYNERLPFNRKRLISHNAYIGMAAESGLPGLFLYVLLCVAGVREAMVAARGLRLGFPVIGLQAVAAEHCLILLMIAGLTGNMERLKYLYVFSGLALSLGRMARVRVATQDSGAPAAATAGSGPEGIGMEVAG